MFKYFVKRLLLAVVTLFVVIGVTFFAMNAVPGGPFDSEKAPSEEVKAILEERYNLNKPLPEQFVLYLGNILHGDFGVSIKTGRSISSTIASSFKVSAAIGWRAILVAVFFGILLGCTAAHFSQRWPDRLIVFLSSLLVSVPGFVIASVLMLVFCLELKLVPVWSAENTSYVLPVIALSLSPMANIIRFSKAGMLDALGQNYVRTARAEGIPGWKIQFKYALRNAAIPIITYIGPMAAGVLTGSVVIETVFTIGGLGSQFVAAITNRDYSLILGVTIFMSIVIVLITFISDVVYKAIDPRIKF